MSRSGISSPDELWLGRSTYMTADLYFTIDFFFFRCLISELTERNSTICGHMVGSKCNLKTHVHYMGYSLPLQIGDPKTTFLDDFDRKSTATLTAYIIGMKQGIHKWVNALQTTRGLLHRLKTT